MNRHLHYHILYAAAVILWGLLTIAACDGSSRRAAMLAVLDEADSLNRNYIPITTDSLLLQATAYFGSHGTPNERLRAHYLLGCAYRDMGEAPQAIEAWQDAIACADTTASDCEYKLLGKAYSQMANQLHRQLLLSDEIDARKQAYLYSLMSGDTLVAIHEYKMIAGPFLLQNKNDSAEIILKQAINLYERLGHPQEGLKASLMLMFLYVEQISQLSALKKLIDRFETESTLFDENHELPPAKRQFYYYKGRYYEGINQLDSAELYYRKIYRPNMSFLNANPMYKGLLSVYKQEHIGDSIAKYADLYCMSIDSSSILKDRELTAQLSASYNYSRYQKLALNNAQKANQRLVVVVVLLAIVLLGIITALFFYRQYKKKKIKLEELQREYEEAQNNFNRIQKRLLQLDEKYKEVFIVFKKENAESQEIITMLSAQHEEEKKQLIQELHLSTERVEQLERQLNISQYTKISLPFLSLGVVRRIKMFAADGQQQLSENDLRTLTDAAKEHFPDLITDMDGMPAITPLAKNVCLLTMLNLRPGEIVNLLGISSSQVSNLRREVNAALFNENTTRTLFQNLSKRYKILSS